MRVERRTRVTAPPGGAAAAPGTPRALMLGLVSAIVLLLAIIALVAYPRFVEQTGEIDIVTDPPGASIEIDGQDRGTNSAAGWSCERCRPTPPTGWSPAPPAGSTPRPSSR